MNLPIESILPQVKRVLREGRSAVVAAEPGAGKTTRVPLALLSEPWLEGRRILMLEPRRMAARAAAGYMARALGENVGETVGYRVRMDSRTGPKTRIEVVTEGVLTRMLQADPSLEGTGLVIFDEFHERSLQADLGLALTLHSRELLREDLRIVVMSATLDTGAVSALLGGAPVLASQGRVHPVETLYLQRRTGDDPEAVMAGQILEALEREEGDVLAFLPGGAEIRRTAALLAGRIPGNVRVLPLYGSLPQEQQDAALVPAPAGRRKVVLATSIAETSLTVEGVRIVIDSGRMRVPRFSPRTGMTRLATVPVSRASADQRRGRAGRLGPGVCRRLWTREEDRALAPHGTPELLEADLAPLALELAAWGAAPDELRWLDAPPPATYAQACALLRQLGALDAAGSITAHGRRMAQLGAHPRLAHMMLRAIPLGLGGLACELAALLGERDFLRGGPPNADVRLRLDALRGGKAAAAAGFTVDEGALRRIRAEAAQWRRQLGLAGGGDAGACGLLLAFAYPDRVGARRGPGRFLLANGRGAFLPEGQPLQAASYLTAAELDDAGADGRIYLAAPVSPEELERQIPDKVREEETVAWDHEAQAVRARRRRCYGALILKEEPLSDPDPDVVLQALLGGIRKEGTGLLPWNREARRLQERLIFMHRHGEGWPDASEEALLGQLEHWLAPRLYGMKSRADLQRLNLAAALLEGLSREQRRELEHCAPDQLAVPSGSRIRIDYSNPDAPVLAVRLQELFGLRETPRIARGRVPLTVHLLSPAGRPVQVTRDLASFWREAYFEVKKDLKGRYPRHDWPDDPLAAAPSRRVRPRS
jgi:ATP-dependent helicase HrpB